MTTDPIGGRRLTPCDRKLLQALANVSHILCLHERPVVHPYRMTGWGFTGDDYDILDEVDVLRLSRTGLVAHTEITDDGHTLVISPAGRRALETGWRVLPEQQQAFFPKTGKRRKTPITD